MIATLLAYFFLASLVVFLIAVILSLVSSASILSTLRDAHPRVFEELGRPSLIGSSRESKSRYAAYFKTAKYFELDDLAINQAYQRWNTWNKLAMTAFGILLVCMLVIFVRH